ncbi:MAG: hypothetical protein ABI910_16165 [Gemmatimonadota bacterium]
MRRLRQFGILLALPLLFQFVLAAEAIGCVEGTAGQATGRAGTDAMPGMDMPPVSTVPASNDSSSPDRAPCNGPFGPGTCQPLAACSLAAMTLTDARVAEPELARSPLPESVVLAPHSRTTRPALPPPKA